MDMKRKLELIDLSIKSISMHEDEDAQVRQAALDRVIEMVKGEKVAIEAKVAADISDKLG